MAVVAGRPDPRGQQEGHPRRIPGGARGGQIGQVGVVPCVFGLSCGAVPVRQGLVRLGPDRWSDLGVRAQAVELCQAQRAETGPEQVLRSGEALIALGAHHTLRAFRAVPLLPALGDALHGLFRGLPDRLAHPNVPLARDAQLVPAVAVHPREFGAHPVQLAGPPFPLPLHQGGHPQSEGGETGEGQHQRHSRRAERDGDGDQRDGHQHDLLAGNRPEPHIATAFRIGDGCLPRGSDGSGRTAAGSSASLTEPPRRRNRRSGEGR